MRKMLFAAALMIVTGFGAGPTEAARPVEDKKKADFIVSGVVTAIYSRDCIGYWSYVVEIKIDQVEKGASMKNGDTFRASCYQRKDGKASLEFDTAGHTSVPKEGQRIKAYVFNGHGRNEGAYPDWFEVLPKPGN